MAMPLYINTSDLESISGIIREATEKVSHAFDKTDDVAVPNAISPHLISRALKQFMEVLYRVDSDQFVAQTGTVDYEVKYPRSETTDCSCWILSVNGHGF